MEKYGYIIQLLLNYPQFYDVVHSDYYMNASKSAWSIAKVIFYLELLLLYIYYCF
jgi:hypothetical protein